MTFRPAPALAALALIVACKPDPAVVHRKAGDELMQRGDFAGAAVEYAQSLAADPRQVKTWEKLAFSRVKTGEKDLAAEALAKMAELEAEPAKKAEAYRNAAGVFLQGQGDDRQKAEKYLLEAVRLDPNDDASLIWLGELASERGGARHALAPVVPAELDKALGYYAQLIERRPDEKAPHLNRRIVLERYLGELAAVKRVEESRLRSTRGAQASAEARERIARIDAKTPELRRMLAESNEKLTGVRAAVAR